MHVLCGGPTGYRDSYKPRTRGRECSSRCIIEKMLLHLLAGSAGCGSSTNMDSSGPSGYDSLGASRLDIGTLATTVQRLLQSDLAPATQRVYLVGKKKYLCFCQETSTPHLPVTEFKLVNFVAYAASRGLKHPTIKCYLSAILHLQIECGGKDPRVESMPLLVLALWGTKREQAGAVKRTRLPITPVILSFFFFFFFFSLNSTTVLIGKII